MPSEAAKEEAERKGKEREEEHAVTTINATTIINQNGGGQLRKVESINVCRGIFLILNIYIMTSFSRAIPWPFPHIIILTTTIPIIITTIITNNPIIIPRLPPPHPPRS
jgi:hypothetical protein